MNNIEEGIINFAEIIKGRYNSNNPKITFMVQTDIFNSVNVYKFGIIKLEDNKVFGWLWTTKEHKVYVPFDITDNNRNNDIQIKVFKNKKSADNYALWLVMNGSKMQNVE